MELVLGKLPRCILNFGTFSLFSLVKIFGQNVVQKWRAQSCSPSKGLSFGISHSPSSIKFWLDFVMNMLRVSADCCSFLATCGDFSEKTASQHDVEKKPIKQFCSPSETAEYRNKPMKRERGFGGRERRE